MESFERKRVRVTKAFTKPSRTKQSARDTTNINQIVARARGGQPLPVHDPGSAFYGDFSTGLDFQVTLDRVNYATELFERLPSRVRDAVANDPARLIDELATVEGRERLRAAGMRIAREPTAAEPDPAPASDPAPDPAPDADPDPS